jgi:hypothetical protein
MHRYFLLLAAAICMLSINATAQNSNANSNVNSNANDNATSRQRSATTTKNANSSSQKPTPSPTASPSMTAATGSTKGKTATAKPDPTSGGVSAAFDRLVDGIKKANVDEVTSVYLNSPRLVLFNNNGTVTRGWDQLRANRQASYPNVKDVKLDIKDKRITMLGRDGAVVTCLWTQSQTVKGVPETGSGRMTLVFQREGNTWKVVHLHTSPDAPDPSKVMPSEQQTTKGAEK